jgi:TolA-binding protein
MRNEITHKHQKKQKKESSMRILVLAIVLTFISFSLCMADNGPVQKAYALYYQGKTQAAIQLMQDHLAEQPDPKALYFLGYVYYEQKDMKTALKYFEEAYLIDPDVSPMVWKK